MSRPDRPRAPHVPLRLSPRRRLFAWIVGWAVWGSGVAWLVFHYFLPAQGPFGPQANPTEIWWLRGHAAMGFLALWGFGMIWSAHIVPGWHARRRCWSGGTAFAVLAALVASGYLIYYVTDDTWHEGIALVHWIVGLGLPLVVVLHVMRGRRVRQPR